MSSKNEYKYISAGRNYTRTYWHTYVRSNMWRSSRFLPLSSYCKGVSPLNWMTKDVSSFLRNWHWCYCHKTLVGLFGWSWNFSDNVVHYNIAQGRMPTKVILHWLTGLIMTSFYYKFTCAAAMAIKIYSFLVHSLAFF